MLNSDEVNRFHSFYETKLEEARRAFATKVSEIYRPSTVRGLPPTPGQVMQIVRVADAFLVEQAVSGFEDLKRILEAVPADRLQRDQLVPMLCEKIEAQFRERRYNLGAENEKVGNQVGIDEPLLTTRDNLIRRYTAEIEQYVVTRKSKPEPGGGQTITVNNTGTIGSIQTGSGSVANVQQRWTANDLAPMLRALQEFRNEVEREQSIDPGVRGDLNAVINDTENEVKEEKPNRIRLTGYLQGVATTIQTLPALQPAWEAVKAAAALLGMPI